MWASFGFPLKTRCCCPFASTPHPLPGCSEMAQTTSSTKAASRPSNSGSRQNTRPSMPSTSPFCQGYPAARNPADLQGLTLTEECLITRGHPIASIVKLRPHGASYQRLQGHIIVLPQEPGALLDILPSAEINLPEKIKVIWFGDRVPTAEDLKPCLEVRKESRRSPCPAVAPAV